MQSWANWEIYDLYQSIPCQSSDLSLSNGKQTSVFHFHFFKCVFNSSSCSRFSPGWDDLLYFLSAFATSFTTPQMLSLSFPQCPWRSINRAYQSALCLTFENRPLFLFYQVISKPHSRKKNSAAVFEKVGPQCCNWSSAWIGLTFLNACILSIWCRSHRSRRSFCVNRLSNVWILLVCVCGLETHPFIFSICLQNVRATSTFSHRFCDKNIQHIQKKGSLMDNGLVLRWDFSHVVAICPPFSANNK